MLNIVHTGLSCKTWSRSIAFRYTIFFHDLYLHPGVQYNPAPLFSVIISQCAATDHGKEDAKLRVHIHVISICEDKVFASFLLARENYCNLLGRHRQNREVDAVELVKTAPGTRLCQTWKHTNLSMLWCNALIFNTTNCLFSVWLWLIKEEKKICGPCSNTLIFLVLLYLHKICMDHFYKYALWVIPLNILPNPRKSIWSEQLKTTTYFPRQRPMSFVVSVLPINRSKFCHIL